MSKAIPNPGNHRAVLAGEMIPYEAESGSFCLAIPVKVIGSGVEWQGKHTITLQKSDGTPQKRSIDTVKKIFGWDGQIESLYDLCESDLSACEFEIVGEHKVLPPAADDPDGQERTVFSIQWMNPVGGSTNMPEKIDRKAAIAKYGSKFKALAGTSKPSAAKSAPASKPAPTPAAKPAVGGPPGRKSTAAAARTSTQEEVWDGLTKANEGTAEDELVQKYYDAIDGVVPDGSTNPESLTPTQWGKVAEALGV